MKPGSIFSQIRIDPLPDGLLGQILGPVRQGRVSRQTLVSYIRHRLTNYDRLCMDYKLDGLHRKILKDEINQRIRELVKAHPVLSLTNTWPSDTRRQVKKNRQAERSHQYDKIEPIK